MKSADQKIYVSDTAQYTAVSKFAGGYEMVILGTLGILCGIYFLVRNVLWISMSEDIQKSRITPHDWSYRKTDYENLPEANEVTYVKRFCLGKLALCSDFSLNDTGNIRVSFFIRKWEETRYFPFCRPWILLLSVVFVNGILWIASEGIIRKITKLSCIESATYDGNMGDRK